LIPDDNTAWIESSLLLARQKMDKHALLQNIIAHLQRIVVAGTESARATTAAATDPDSKAENKYDTRNLEASYLARGQAFRVAEAQEALVAYETMIPRNFSPSEPIGEGAIVSLTGSDGTLHYLIGPAAGGTELREGEEEITIITPSSPLGAKLLRRRAGDTLELQPGRPGTKVTITAVE
jgi:transcription elongation GreA/GreB family factor